MVARAPAAHRPLRLPDPDPDAPWFALWRWQAAAFNQVGEIRYLRRCVGREVDLTDLHGRTPLMLACKYGQLQAAQVSLAELFAGLFCGPTAVLRTLQDASVLALAHALDPLTSAPHAPQRRSLCATVQVLWCRATLTKRPSTLRIPRSRGTVRVTAASRAVCKMLAERLGLPTEWQAQRTVLTFCRPQRSVLLA